MSLSDNDVNVGSSSATSCTALLGDADSGGSLCVCVKAVVFLVVMSGCESWTIKKAEHQRVDAFELWCWRRLLSASVSKQSILREINPEYSLEGLMLKLKLQYFGHDMNSCLIGKVSDSGKD